jgi:hypothetical protein
MTLELFVCLVLLSAFPAIAQDVPKSIALTNKSNVPPGDISKEFQKRCPEVGVTNDLTKSDYTLEAIKTPRKGVLGETSYTFDLTVFDRDGNTFHSAWIDSMLSLGDAVKLVCHAIKTAVIVEVVDTQTLTESVDVRGTGTGIVAVGRALTGRRTHTDTSSIYVIVNGEHATLDCYERRTGCATIGPGKYYGELDGGSLWVNYEMPLTHKALRNHYVIAGSW